jgi:hypothetical protein
MILIANRSMIIFLLLISHWNFHLDLSREKMEMIFKVLSYSYNIRCVIMLKYLKNLLVFIAAMSKSGFLAPRFETLRVNILGWNLIHAFLRSKSRPNIFLWSSASLEPSVESPKGPAWLPDFELLGRVSKLNFFVERFLDQKSRPNFLIFLISQSVGFLWPTYDISYIQQIIGKQNLISKLSIHWYLKKCLLRILDLDMANLQTTTQIMLFNVN